MTYQKSFKCSFFILFMFIASSMYAQDIKKDKMEQLNFLIGEWIGTSTIYKNGVATKQAAAYEKISYDLDKSILVIELNTEFLQLRTIINYDERDKKYYYHRFSKEGAAKYPAAYKDGKLIVYKDKNTRFFFGSTADGNFQEYGEQLINGEWTKTFEDTFKNTL